MTPPAGRSLHVHVTKSCPYCQVAAGRARFLGIPRAIAAELWVNAAQTIADRGAEPALKRLGRKHTIPFRKGFGIGDQTFGFLKALKHRILA